MGFLRARIISVSLSFAWRCTHKPDAAMQPVFLLGKFLGFNKSLGGLSGSVLSLSHLPDCCAIRVPWIGWKGKNFVNIQFSSVQSLSPVRLFTTPWIAAHQASLSITNSQSSLKLKSIESVMPSSHLILGCPLLRLPPIPPSIRVFSNESTLRIRWSNYWSFSFSISPSSEHPGLVSFRMD